MSPSKNMPRFRTEQHSSSPNSPFPAGGSADGSNEAPGKHCRWQR